MDVNYLPFGTGDNIDGPVMAKEYNLSISEALMKRMIKNNLKDNRGFSLVEVLVAMVIIALVVAPIAALFSSSVRMNMVSKRRMNAVGIAEDTMEAIKANSISDLCYKFHDLTKFDLIDTDLFTTNTPASNVHEISTFAFGASGISHVIYPGATDDYDFVPDADGDGTPESQYFYEIDNIQFQDGKEVYDALVKVDATPYKAASLADPELQRIRYNSSRLVDVATIAGDENFAYQQSDSMDTQGFADLSIASFDSTQVNRTITVNIEPGSSKNTYIDYEYVEKTNPLNTKTYGSVCEPFVSDDTKEIKNVFLFYRRDYDFNKEDIVINCDKTTGGNVNVYIVKLEPAATGLDDREKDYRVTVNITGTGKGKIKVLTNIDYNLAHTLDETKTETYPQGTFKFAGSPLGPSTSPKKDEVVFDLANTTSKDRFYDIQIDIYRQDDHSTPIYTLTGSTQE